MNNFDWALARDNCSTSAAFEELCTNIEKDVDARNKLSKKTVIAFQRTRDSHTEIRTEDDKKGVDASNTLSKEPAYVCLTNRRQPYGEQGDRLRERHIQTNWTANRREWI